MHAPGLVVIMPSTPYDAKGLLTAAIRDDNPVVFLEKRLLYSRARAGARGRVHRSDRRRRHQARGDRRHRRLLLGRASIWRCRPAGSSPSEGIELEVVDLRTLKPLDIETLGDSVRKTGRLVVVSEGARAGGFASEVVARVIDEAYDSLRAAPVRVTAKDTPIPYAAQLERAVMPQVDDLVAAVTGMLEPVPGS